MPKRSYTLAFKKNAVEMAKKSNNRTVARDLGVDEKRIREWRSLASHNGQLGERILAPTLQMSSFGRLKRVGLPAMILISFIAPR